ncbi:MAG: hypothetical protein QY306_06060 [Anaerolineales bacterium]|nr:MAG: hypothetical protein QY306_06060 [Anaerolineales bacterium]
MPKEVFRKYPVTSFAIGIISLLLFASLVAGEDSVITNTIFQLKMCGTDNYACVLVYHFVFAAIMVALGYVFDIIFFRPKIYREKHKIQPSAQNAPAEFYKPKRDELAYRMGLEVHNFYEQFKLIKNTLADKRRAQHSEAKELWNKIYKERLPQSKMILQNWREIEKVIVELNRRLDRYESALNSYRYYQDERKLWDKSQTSPPQEIVDKINENMNLLWGEGNNLEVQIDPMVQRLIKLLHDEGENEN